MIASHTQRVHHSLKKNAKLKYKREKNFILDTIICEYMS